MRCRAYSATGPFTSGFALAERNSGLFCWAAIRRHSKSMPGSSPKEETSVPLYLLQAVELPTQSLPKMIEIGSKWGPGTLGGRPEARFGPKVEKRSKKERTGTKNSLYF